MSELISRGFVIAIIGYIIVFTALVVLTLVFQNIPRIITLNIRKRLRERGKKGPEEESDLMVQGEVSAAISLSLHMYFNELHDPQSNILTIKKVSRAYSPWSSKIYGLRNYRRP